MLTVKLCSKTNKTFSKVTLKEKLSQDIYLLSVRNLLDHKIFFSFKMGACLLIGKVLYQKKNCLCC